MHSEQTSFGGYVRVWHKPDLRLAASEGPLTGALPTFGAERRLPIAERADRDTVEGEVGFSGGQVAQSRYGAVRHYDQGGKTGRSHPICPG